MQDGFAAQLQHVGKARRQPPTLAMAGGGAGAVLPPLDASEIFIHFLWRPAGVAGGVADSLPITVVRANDDHGVMRRAAAERPGSRVVDTLAAGGQFHLILGILRLALFVRIV